MTTMEQRLEEYLSRHIPLSDALQVEVAVALPDRILLKAPLAPNSNHRGTAFGGSIYALALLAGWSWLYVTFRDSTRPQGLVIQRAECEYRGTD